MELQTPPFTSDQPPGTASGVIDRNRVLLEGAERFTYKTVDGTSLHAYVYAESARSARQPRPVALFFFSGSWDGGLISQFAPHALHLAQRGAVGILFDYRVSSRHQTTPLEAMADARSAVRWVRANAEVLSIDPSKVIGIGGSGGAHIICAAAMLNGFDDQADDLSISCKPDALILFSPILDTTRKGMALEKFPDKKTAKQASPLHHVRGKLPPMLLFHGTNDRVAPHATSKAFVRKMRWRWKKEKCRLSTFDREGHGFFNFNVDARLYELTLTEMDHFLVECGFLDPSPEADSDLRLNRR